MNCAVENISTRERDIRVHTIPIDKMLSVGPRKRDIGCTQASVSATIIEDDPKPATTLLYKSVASRDGTPLMITSVGAALRDVAIAEADGVTNPWQTAGIKAAASADNKELCLMFSLLLRVSLGGGGRRRVN